MNLVKSSQGSHWYLPDGKPFYECQYADPSKGTRNATIKDARKVGAVPSVTTIQKVIAKPALNNWLQEQAIMAALTLPRFEDEHDDAFAKRVVVDMGEQSKAAMALGTSVHDAIEAAVKGEPVADDMLKYVAPVSKLFEENKIVAEKTELSFANNKFGGRIDLAGTIDGQPCIIDYKTQSTKNGKINAYPEWAEQLYAYANGLKMNDARLINIVVSTTEDNGVVSLVKMHEWDGVESIRRGWWASYDLWCVRNNWDAIETARGR